MSLSCNKCGAPLEVPQGTNFATCSYCSSRLAIHVAGSVAYTEVLQGIDHKTSQILNKVEALERHLKVPRHETCEIGWAPGPRYGERSGTLVFVAALTTSAGPKVFSQSGPAKYNLQAVARAQYAPTQTVEAQHALADLVRVLEDDGWELVSTGDFWFGHTLRRELD